MDASVADQRSPLSPQSQQTLEIPPPAARRLPTPAPAQMDASVADQRRHLCDVICEYYQSAYKRLTPRMRRRLHKVGVCVGFLDPVSNIIANTVISKRCCTSGKKKRSQTDTGGKKIGGKRSQPDTGGCSSGKKWRSRNDTGDSTGGEMVMTGISTDFSELAARSLRGLVTFLTTYFRYLDTCGALYYLRRCRADLLAAVLIIEQHRVRNTFSSSYPLTKMALYCAALSAMHPQPETFVSSSLFMACRISCRSAGVSLMDIEHGSDYILAKINEADAGGKCNAEEWQTAMDDFTFDNLDHFRVNVDPPTEIDDEIYLKRILLDKIHLLYLVAISRIPRTLLRTRLHRALLKAGHCYGPFDPVSNILLNTIWYDTVFPTQHELEVDMIRMSLAIAESRSLHGLVTFLCFLYPQLSKKHVLLRLLDSASIDEVFRTLCDGQNQRLAAAFQVAATNACHPNPAALAEFAAVLLPVVEVTVKPLLEAKHILSPDDVQSISKVVSDKHIGSVVLAPELIPIVSQIVSASRKEFQAHQSLICKMVEAALHEHTRRQGDEYDLHCICGVNMKIPQDGKFGYFLNRNGYPFSHINVWVTRRGSHHADEVPILLFIECSNNCEDMKDMPFLCSIVSASSEVAGRCFHCECAGSKIVHPSLGSYCGQRKDFEDMACGKHSFTNKELIRSGELGTVFVDAVETQDFIYFDPACDSDSAVWINRLATTEMLKEIEVMTSSSEQVGAQIANIRQDLSGSEE